MYVIKNEIVIILLRNNYCIPGKGLDDFHRVFSKSLILSLH